LSLACHETLKYDKATSDADVSNLGDFMEVKEAKSGDHWDGYYKSQDTPSMPSQFAVFSFNEFFPSAVVDVGCGSGRDAFFFASQNIPTIGIDGSQSAVDLCSSRIVSNQKVSFQRHDVHSDGLSRYAIDLLDEWQVDGPILVYARFFVHAIDEDGERHLLQHAQKLLSRFGGVFAVEFRTTRDRAMEKVTPDHYRRFVNPAHFVLNAEKAGLTVTYSVEGFGMAKYREDDAHVARMLLILK